jgi:hypothetical protein
LVASAICGRPLQHWDWPLAPCGFCVDEMRALSFRNPRSFAVKKIGATMHAAILFTDRIVQHENVGAIRSFE